MVNVIIGTGKTILEKPEGQGVEWMENLSQTSWPFRKNNRDSKQSYLTTKYTKHAEMKVFQLIISWSTS